MDKPLEKFQNLLRELFQFDCADLDFGIYRIMNHKRDVIERFIGEDLPQAIAKELNRGALADQSRAVEELEEVAQQIRNTLSRDAIDANGKLVRFRDTDIGKKYLNLQAKAEGGRGHKALEASIFNHLYAFFSRYYQDGDFISKRRYSKRQRYAIPYNGEEVYLYWANSDQYYVKTAEHFRNYTFVSRGVTVRFELQTANVEQNNVQGAKRFFLPHVGQTAWDGEVNEVFIAFDYRPLTQQEKIRFGNRNQQKKIIAEAAREIPKSLKKTPTALAALAAEKRLNSTGQPVNFLEHHLRQYTRRNTSDFFIHQNLNGFLSRELDFYLKNEVLNLGEMEVASEERAEGWFQTMRVIKSVGGRIIEFLDQIENFQKMLWEKRKFITETQYCIAVGCIDESFYPAIAACEAQWTGWKALFHIDEEEVNLFNSGQDKNFKRIIFLKTRPTLVLDTRHFGQDLVDRLLASFDDLDALTDGLLIHSENWQALNLLTEKYSGQLQCAHIDPPYNTQTSGFLYKNEYQHSSWLSMMHNRVAATVPLLRKDGAFLCHIDENEYEVLHLLLANMGIPDAGTVVWDKKNPMLGRKGIATQHEYVLWRTWSKSSVYLRPANVRMMLDKAESLIHEHGGVNRRVRRVFSDWVKHCEGLTGGERAYRLIDDDGRVYRSVAMGAPEPRTDPKFYIPLIHPITEKQCPVPPNGWSRTPETLRELMKNNEIVFGKGENVQPTRKVFLKPDSGRQLSSVLRDASRGKNDVEKLGLEFPYCHPVSLYVELLGAAAADSSDVVLDYFAGSGTTGHAGINLNREDGGRRKFILVEMGDHFDTVLLPRIKKVTFTPQWKKGKPKRMATPEEAERGPRIVKYLRLESYEDALNNIDFDESSTQRALQFDDYLLKYMLQWETRRSETLLNVEKLSRPFCYTLHIHADDQTRKQIADIPETFNYLLGLHVRTRRVHDDDGRRYLVYRGQNREGRRVVVIWRETEGWQKSDFERDKEFVSEQELTAGADQIFVNGDSFIPKSRALEPVFKARMFAGVDA